MKTPFLSLQAIAFACCCHGQPIYTKFYDAGGGASLIELESGNGLNRFAYSSSDNVTGTSLLDQNGNVILSNCRLIDTMLVLIGLAKYTDNEYVFTSAYYKDTCTLNGNAPIRAIYPVVGRMDSLGNILSANYYQLNSTFCTNIGGNMEVVANKSVITWGRSYLFKVDSTGSPIWSKCMDREIAVRFVKELPGGELLVGMNATTDGAVLARLDANGDFIWCKSFMPPTGMVHDVFLESEDEFVVTGTTQSDLSTNIFIPLPNDFNPKLFILKMDGTGEVQWCKGYDSGTNPWHTPTGSRTKRLADGTYVIAGTLGQADLNMFHRTFLMKTSENGDTLWTRAMGRTGYDYSATSLSVYSDGGFLIGGSIWGALPDDLSGVPYIAKTDSLGHFACWERHHSIEVLDLFPTDSSITLAYTLGITMHPAFHTPAPCDPITVYSGCTFTTGMPRSIAAKPRLYPNPTPGRFTVEFADPLMADSYYSVYDPLGKLLLQRPLPAGATLQEVDLSRFGSGTYAIKFTSPDNVCYERVVLE